MTDSEIVAKLDEIIAAIPPTNLIKGTLIVVSACIEKRNQGHLLELSKILREFARKKITQHKASLN